MSKKVLITGVTGQDGSYMADYLLSTTDYEIYGIVRRSAKPDYSNLTLALENKRFHLVTGDLSDSQSIDRLVAEFKPDYFINLAAQSFVGASWKIPEQTVDVTGLGVLRCLEAIRKFAPNCRFYSAGSSEEMGDVQYSPQTLDHPIRPRSPYGAAKAFARHITKVYRESYGIFAIHSILYNHESERRGEEFVTRKITKKVTQIARSLSKQQLVTPLELGNLDSKRDWSYAPDFIRGIWMMLNQDEPKEYILSSNETHSIREFVELSFKAVGIEGIWSIDKNRTPLSEIFTFVDKYPTGLVLVKINPDFFRPAEVDLLLGDSTPARTELGWKPDVSFQQLVDRMIKHDYSHGWKS